MASRVAVVTSLRALQPLRVGLHLHSDGNQTCSRFSRLLSVSICMWLRPAVLRESLADVRDSQSEGGSRPFPAANPRWAPETQQHPRVGEDKHPASRCCFILQPVAPTGVCLFTSTTSSECMNFNDDLQRMMPRAAAVSSQLPQEVS